MGLSSVPPKAGGFGGTEVSDVPHTYSDLDLEFIKQL